MLAFAYPIRDHEAVQRLLNHVQSDSGTDLHHAHRQHGIQDVNVFVQERPSAELIIVVRGDNLAQASRDRHDNEEVKKLNQMIYDATGHSPEIHMDQQPRMIHSWSA